jgi:hypothetical protein
MVTYVARSRTIHKCTAPTCTRLAVFIRNRRLTGIIAMCLPCEVLNYLVCTGLQDLTGCLLCVLPVSHTLVRLIHVSFIKTAHWQTVLQTNLLEYCREQITGDGVKR